MDASHFRFISHEANGSRGDKSIRPPRPALPLRPSEAREAFGLLPVTGLRDMTRENAREREKVRLMFELLDFGCRWIFFADCLTESLRNPSRYRISGCMWKWMWKIGKFRMSILCVVWLICNWGWLIDGGFFCVCFVLIFKLWFLYWFKMYRDMIWLNLNSCKFELILEVLW